LHGADARGTLAEDFCPRHNRKRFAVDAFFLQRHCMEQTLAGCSHRFCPEPTEICLSQPPPTPTRHFSAN